MNKYISTYIYTHIYLARRPWRTLRGRRPGGVVCAGRTPRIPASGPAHVKSITCYGGVASSSKMTDSQRR